jgi:hypothetical protein
VAQIIKAMDWQECSIIWAFLRNIIYFSLWKTCNNLKKSVNLRLLNHVNYLLPENVISSTKSISLNKQNESIKIYP